MTERVSRRTTFNDAAAQYDAIRPLYRSEVFDCIEDAKASGDVLEIGCGTGQATRGLAARGFAVDAVELGTDLAARARINMVPWPRVNVRCADFETCELGTYDLVTSFSAFHWIDPATGYRRCADVLRPGGKLALVWHEHPGAVWPFAQDVQKVYEERFPGASDGDFFTIEQRIEQRRAAIVACGSFQEPTIHSFPWEYNLTTDNYLRLLDTFSDHRTLEPSVKQALFDALAALIDGSYGGIANRRYVTSVFLAEPSESSSSDV